MSGAALPIMVVLPFAGGLAAWAAGQRSALAARITALVSLALGLVATVAAAAGSSGAGPWMASFSMSWIPRFGIRIHLGLDGLSLAMTLLTSFLGIVSVLVSWSSIRTRVGFFHLNLLWVLAGVTGVFLALDLFLFYFFWELMLLPMALLIAIWGSERRTAAAIKFFIFTQAGGLLLLVSTVGLVVAHARATGVLTFDAVDLVASGAGGARSSTWLFLGFLAAFAVKLPALPLHTWLPDAHSEAPTAGSVLLAGLLLKTGAYGMLRFAVPLFPEAAERMAPWLMALGAAGILYGAWLAFAQTDVKRLVAYTSVSHLGFVLLGIFAWNQLALEGVVMQMICHGLSTGALFVVAGGLYERLHTREMGEMGGLWPEVPRMGSIALFFALASLGLPGLGNFIAELLILLGSFRVSEATTAVAAVGLVSAAIYSLWFIQKVFLGPNSNHIRLADLRPVELAVLLTMALGLVWLGLYPQPVLDAVRPALNGLLAVTGAGGWL